VAAALFVDSSAWIAVASTRDRRHGEADHAMREALQARTRLVTTNLVLAEVQRWLLFRAGPLPARAALARIQASPSVEVTFATRAHHVTALGWLARLQDQRLSYTDAVSFAVMRERRCDTALTFDRDFTVAGFRRVPS
jgi:predicted nucleic acid-binding protein